MLHKENENGGIRRCEADIDILLDNLLDSSHYKQKLWNEFGKPRESKDNIVLESSRYFKCKRSEFIYFLKAFYCEEQMNLEWILISSHI